MQHASGVFPVYNHRVILQDFFIGISRKALRQIFLAIFIIVVTLEIALRFLAPFSETVRLVLWGKTSGMQFDFIQSVDDIARFNPDMSEPGSYHAGYPLDEHGFWTESYTRTKKPGVLRMVSIGDSFTFSSGVSRGRCSGIGLRQACSAVP